MRKFGVAATVLAALGLCAVSGLAQVPTGQNATKMVPVPLQLPARPAKVPPLWASTGVVSMASAMTAGAAAVRRTKVLSSVIGSDQPNCV